ncbi:Ribonuclease HI [hydrothermal vent metagenome]|uniref:Ribonuclease HI n=1 Tax=hydrothermal vent metagenome TaxID=652676 RepID=A0A3B1D7A4_9ZZZZ
MSQDLEIFTDGACSGNPGPAGIGVVINRDGKRLKEISRSIGEATNNIAEYSALICALQEALIFKANRLNVFMDSELICKQIAGSYKVKNEKLKPLFDQVKQLLRGFENVNIQHVLRAKNKEADKLATAAVKRKKQVM